MVRRLYGVSSFLAIAISFAAPAPADSIDLGAAANYAILFEGGGGHTLQITNVTTNTTGSGGGQGGGIGNIGVGMGTGSVSGMATVSGPSHVNGEIDFSAAETSPNSQFSNNNSNNTFIGGSTHTPTVNFSDANVTSALNTVNALNTALGAETGTNITISNGGATINTSQSTQIDASGNAVFNVTSFSSNVGDVITIDDNSGVSGVVFNFAGVNANFGATVVLTGGLTPDQVVWNFVGGTLATLHGGPSLSINTNQSSFPTTEAQGIFLDPNGTIQVTNANVLGRIFGGDTNDFQDVSGTNITAPLSSPVPLPTPALAGLGLLGMLAGARWFPRRLGSR